MWWSGCFIVGAQLVYYNSLSVPFEHRQLVERGKLNKSIYLNPVWSRRFDIEGEPGGYRYWLALPANCGGQKGHHVVVQFVPRKCQIIMFVGNGDGKFEERRPYYIEDREVGQGRHIKIRHFKFTAGAPAYFILADRDGRYTVCKVEVADPLATRKIANGTYKTMTVEMTEIYSGVVNGENTQGLARKLGMMGLLASPIIQAVQRARQSSPRSKSFVPTTGSEASEAAQFGVA